MYTQSDVSEKCLCMQNLTFPFYQLDIKRDKKILRSCHMTVEALFTHYASTQGEHVDIIQG